MYGQQWQRIQLNLRVQSFASFTLPTLRNNVYFSLDSHRFVVTPDLILANPPLVYISALGRAPSQLPCCATVLPCCAYPEELEQARRESSYLVIRDNSVEFNNPKVTRKGMYVLHTPCTNYWTPPCCKQHDNPACLV